MGLQFYTIPPPFPAPIMFPVCQSLSPCWLSLNRKLQTLLIVSWALLAAWNQTALPALWRNSCERALLLTLAAWKEGGGQAFSPWVRLVQLAEEETPGCCCTRTSTEETELGIWDCTAPLWHLHLHGQSVETADVPPVHHLLLPSVSAG